MALVEREHEARVLADAIDAATSGRGSTVLLTGPAGIGKTSLMDLAEAMASRAGLQVLRARVTELESELGFCVLRDLFANRIRSLAPSARNEVLAGAARLASGPLGLTADDDIDPGQALHGVYWMCANLADHGPLMLAVDDLHWADESSLTALAYVSRRISGLPVLLCAAARGPSGEDREAHLNALVESAAKTIELKPLSPIGVGRLVQDAFDTQVSAEFAAACANATGGNPLLLAEALAALADDGVQPTAAASATLDTFSPTSLATSVARRVVRCGPHGIAAAKSVAILGTSADPRRIAGLTGIGLDEAVRAVDDLRREGVLAQNLPLDFTHPLVRNAVMATLHEPERGMLHLKAARQAKAEDSDQLASHLLHATPSGDPWVVDWLESAADRALAGGAPAYAARLLRRALEEPPSRSRVPALTLKLGRAERSSGQASAAERHLRQALTLADGQPAQLEATIELGRAMWLGGKPLAALDVFDRAFERAGIDEATRLSIEAERAMGAFMGGLSATTSLNRLESAAMSTTSKSLDACWVRAVFAYGLAGSGERPAAEVIRIADSATPTTGPIPPLLQHLIGVCLAVSGAYDSAVENFDAAIAACRARGDVNLFPYVAAGRSMAMLRRGHVGDAEADACAALTAAADEPLVLVHAAATVMLALLEQGKVDDVEALLRHHDLVETTEPNAAPDTWFYLARGRVHMARGRYPAALVDFERARDVNVGLSNAAFSDWRSDLALAHAAAGSRETAKALAEEDLEGARGFGAPRETGRALRVLGLIEGGPDGLELLAQAVDVLTNSGARLEQATALIAFGSALRRTGRRSEAITHLSSGLDIASSHGGTALVAQALDELRVAGAKPRRKRVTGIDALTPSERRVAEMAMTGQSNRDIAQALFVTRHTVEAHLTNVFRKLNISGRADLKAILEAS